MKRFMGGFRVKVFAVLKESYGYFGYSDVLHSIYKNEEDAKKAVEGLEGIEIDVHYYYEEIEVK